MDQRTLLERLPINPSPHKPRRKAGEFPPKDSADKAIAEEGAHISPHRERARCVPTTTTGRQGLGRDAVVLVVEEMGHNDWCAWTTAMKKHGHGGATWSRILLSRSV